MSELPRATRKYVVLGLVFVVAVALAIRDWTDRGVPNEWYRVLWVYEDRRDGTSQRSDLGGLEVDQLDSSQAILVGRDLLDDPDASALDAAIAYADHHGYGFLLIGLHDNWDLSSLGVDVPADARHAAISIGDVAREGMRVNFGAPATGPLEYDYPSIDGVAIQLALLEHPDLHELFHNAGIDWAKAERSRWELGMGNGDFVHQVDLLRHQQKWVADVEELWPDPKPGNLGRRWEGAHAVPVHGGIMLEIMPVRFAVQSNALKSELRHSGVSELSFVSTEALAAGLDPIVARRPCVGVKTDDELWQGLEVSPDGRTIATGDHPLDIYRSSFERPDACGLEWIGERETEDASFRVSNAGGVSWVGYSGWAGWQEAGGQPEQLLDGSFTIVAGPWWSGDNLFGLHGYRYPLRGVDSVIMLVRTDSSADSQHIPRALLPVSALFPRLEPGDPIATLIHVQPVGPDTLLVVTKKCPGSIGYDAPRPCLHRVRFRESVADRLGREPMAKPLELDHRAVAVRTLGPIDTYASLAIASEGARAVYVAIPDTVDAPPSLCSVDIGETSLGPIEKIDVQVYRSSLLSIGPDGRVVVIGGSMSIDEFGAVPTARAFVLPPPGA